MAQSIIVQDTNALESAGVAYSFSGGFHLWTKTGSNAYDSNVVSKKVIERIYEDQSARIILQSILKRLRFGIHSYSQRGVAGVMAACWEIIPEDLNPIIFSDDFGTDFGTPDYDTSKWTVMGSPSSIVVSGNELTIVQSSSGGLKTVNPLDLTNGSVSMKVPIPASNPNVTNGFLISQNDSFSSYFSIDEYNGNLRFNNANGSTSPSSITYNATDHLWMRIRFSGNTTYFDTSPDGVTWTQRSTGGATYAKTGQTLFLRPYVVGTQTAKWADVKVSGPAQALALVAKENGSIVYTSGRTPEADNELRIQIVLDGGVYKLKYYWREDSGSPEQLEYTSSMTDSQVRALWPLFLSAQLYTDGAIAKNLQFEISENDGVFSDFGFYGPFNVKNSYLDLNLRDGAIENSSGPSLSSWVMEFPKAVSTISTVVESYVPVDGTILDLELMTPGVPAAKSAEFDVKLNGVSILSELFVIDNSNPSDGEVVSVAVVSGDVISVHCTNIDTTVARPSGLKIVLEGE